MYMTSLGFTKFTRGSAQRLRSQDNSHRTVSHRVLAHALYGVHGVWSSYPTMIRQQQYYYT